MDIIQAAAAAYWCVGIIVYAWTQMTRDWPGFYTAFAAILLWPIGVHWAIQAYNKRHGGTE